MGDPTAIIFGHFLHQTLRSLGWQLPPHGSCFQSTCWHQNYWPGNVGNIGSHEQQPPGWWLCLPMLETRHCPDRLWNEWLSKWCPSWICCQQRAVLCTTMHCWWIQTGCYNINPATNTKPDMLTRRLHGTNELVQHPYEAKMCSGKQNLISYPPRFPLKCRQHNGAACYELGIRWDTSMPTKIQPRPEVRHGEIPWIHENSTPSCHTQICPALLKFILSYFIILTRHNCLAVVYMHVQHYSPGGVYTHFLQQCHLTVSTR